MQKLRQILRKEIIIFDNRGHPYKKHHAPCHDPALSRRHTLFQRLNSGAFHSLFLFLKALLHPVYQQPRRIHHDCCTDQVYKEESAE